MLQGIDLKEFPHILQFNKRDLRDLLSTEDLNESLNLYSTPIFEAIATEGIGVQESLEGIVKLVMRNLREKYEPVASASNPQGLKPMQATVPGAFQAPAADPPAASSNPLAGEFVSKLESPPKVDFGEVDSPAAASFDEEDEIATAVYEADDEQMAAAEADLEGPKLGEEAPSFAPAEDTGSSEPDIGESDDFGGIFTDPRDEDGTDDDVAAPISAVFEPEPEPAPEQEPEESDDLATDPQIAADRPEPVPSEESLDDLFETEVPTVKAFVEDVMEVVETQGSEAGGDEPAPASIDPPERVVGVHTSDRFEDRIEAPGPFAPPPAPKAVVEEPEETKTEEEAVHDEVRQALGASEDREALASLSVPEIEQSGETVEIVDNSAEEQPFAPEPPIEPIIAEAAEEPEEVPTVDFVVEDPDDSDAEEDTGAWEDEDSKETEVAELAEPPAEKPVFEDIIVEVAQAEEPAADEDVIDEITAEKPVDEQLTAPPSVDDQLTRSQAFMLGSGDPFAEDDEDTMVTELLPQEAPVVPAGNAINVTAQDNQLHLQLKGSGAIAEMGQVRALDIEVPVPGQWVGNRKVTLQLRLTLTPAEDGDG